MPCKIAFIGGGSMLWTGRFATDLFLKTSLRGSSLVLVDHDRQAAELMSRYCQLISDELDAQWDITVMDRDAALTDADFVLVSIATGGFEAFDRDYRIPEAYGVYHAVGDTVGPAGIARTLRNVPVFIELARAMQRLCPDAWMVHVTNPLAQITRAVSVATDIKVVGLCHNFEGTMHALAREFGVDRAALHAETFGVNHFTFLRDLTRHGEPVPSHELSLARYLEREATRQSELVTNTTDDDVNAMTQIGRASCRERV